MWRILFTILARKLHKEAEGAIISAQVTPAIFHLHGLSLVFPEARLPNFQLVLGNFDNSLDKNTGKVPSMIADYECIVEHRGRSSMLVGSRTGEETTTERLILQLSRSVASQSTRGVLECIPIVSTLCIDISTLLGQQPARSTGCTTRRTIILYASRGT